MVQIIQLSEDEVAAIVAEAIRGDESLDVLVRDALFGSEANTPQTWGAWPEEAVATWDLASRMWTDVVREASKKSQPPDREAVWEAIVLLVTLDPWPHVPYLTWADIGTVLHIKPRAATYVCSTIQGWRFTGRDQTRATVLAPCIKCGEVHGAAEILRREGPCCRKSA